MKVLVSTKETQGQRSNDFTWTNEGELLKYGFECDRESVDGSCGCKRSLVGVTTSKATTTMKVIDLPLTPSDFKLLIVASLKREGWITGETTDKEAEELYRAATLGLDTVAASFPVGAVLERRGNTFNRRKAS